MSGQRVPDLTALTGANVASGDLFLITDISDITDDSSGTSKRITAANLGLDVKRYRCLLTQSSTSAPVATVLENTLGGTVAWNYSSTGIYTATLAGVFLTNKVYSNSGTAAGGSLRAVRSTDNIVQLSTRNYAGSLADDILSGDSFEIIVYL